MEPQKNSTRTIGVIIGAVVILALAGITFFSEQKPTDQTATQNDIPAQGTDTTATQNTTTSAPVTSQNIPTESVPATTTPSTPKKVASVYKDGTYSATGSYMSPGGEDQIGVSVTLANDIITAVDATNMAGDRMSSRFQDRFISGYKAYVVGKKISDVHLSRVSGSSLTPAGFNDALTQIKSQAKA